MSKSLNVTKRKLSSILILLAFLLLLSCSKPPEQSSNFNIIDVTISDVHSALENRELTVRELVQMYIDRINKYDQSTKLNSILLINPKALEIADSLDREYLQTGKLRPLHGVPVIVKDNYDTRTLQTAGGSLALKGSIPPDDAFQIKKLKEAGAIVLAKSNMAEWAFSNVVTVSSIAGITRNPYDLSRVPAGSSGGTAAAVAANFGLVGLGTDTGNSIRGPSSHNCLVGIRSTMGLTSRDGIIPLYLRNDIGGPICRTLEDAVKVLEVIAGYDPADPITELSEGKVPENYSQYLIKDSLKGIRLGVFRRYLDNENTDPEIKVIIDNNIKRLEELGAILVDPFDIPNYDELIKDIWRSVFQFDLNNYLATLGDSAPYRSLGEIYDSGLYLPSSKENIEYELKFVGNPNNFNPPALDLYHTEKNIAFRNALLAAMDEYNIDAVIYPTWSNVPREVGDMESPDGDNSQILSPQSGFPAITVPMEFTESGLPTGLTFLGRLFSEPELIKYVYTYEQATNNRKPPKLFSETK
ncbi:MAG: amidase family protein, partial [Melioribacteraceae bacterium]|nr:amidase family protein [Melioribacteraceae bacterium]